MKRKLLLALIALTCALCLVFSLAGCNPAENQSGTQQETPGGQGGEQGGNSDDDKPDTHNYIFKCSQTEHWQVCTDCGEETAHTPHSVSDGVCPACGYVEKCTEGLKFEFNEGIVGYEVSDGTATDSHIFIPSFYNNLPVISIGEYAFSGRKSLTEITIPASVISIGDEAFDGCTSLTEITIPASVTSIGNNAFNGCTSLTEITIPEGVTSIGYYAFYNSGYYNDEANWENEVLYIENYLIEAKDTLSGSYQIAPGTKLIADGAFMECKTLTEITIPDSVTSIGGIAFYYTSLTKITIHDGVTSIGVNAFSNTAYYNDDTNWKNDVLYIGNYLINAKHTLSGSYQITPGTKLIADFALENCTGLTSITIPASVTSIGVLAFYSCISLESIAVDKDNKVYHSEGNCIIEKETKTVIVGCKTSKIPEGVTSIGRYAFSGCYSLTELIIPEGVTSIGEQAFYNCASLTKITIPDSITSIGELAFYNCVNIKTATGPIWAIEYIILEMMYNAYGSPSYLQTVILTSGDSIGDGAFSGCYGLTEITIPDSVTSIGYDAFYNCLNLESITVSEGNQTYSSQDGILYNKNKTEIICIPKAIKGSVIIPDGVTSINSEAFYGCRNLTEITIPDSVTSIGNMAFEDCTSLERVIFENTAGWKVSRNSDMSNFEDINVSDPEQNAENLKDTYSWYYWKRGD